MHFNTGHRLSTTRKAFTLVEILVVITIIAILVGLAFPALNAALKMAKKNQAKADCNQLVVAVKKYYTAYGKYPLSVDTTADAYTWGSSGTGVSPEPDATNDALIPVLMGVDNPLNRKNEVFLEPPLAKAEGSHGVHIQGTTISDFLDPWGNSYFIRVDRNYDGQIPSPVDNTNVFSGVIVWSVGADGKISPSDPDAEENKDNVYSWE